MSVASGRGPAGMGGVKRILIAFALGAALVLAGSPVMAVRIGIFFDRDGTSCNAQVPINTGGTFWILAILDSPPEDGIVAAEFLVSGFPLDWFVSFNPGSETVLQLGTPVFPPGFGWGTYVTFRGCQQGTNRIVELGSITFFANTQESLTLQVVAPSPNSHQGMSCPAVALCDSTDSCAPGLFVPKLTLECVEGLSATINGDPCTVVPTESMTWSRMKALWR